MADVLIQGRDGFFNGYRAPVRSGKGPGIVLIQEIFGVNRVMRDIADWLAGEGYTVVCPDLFWRQEPGIQLNEYTQAEWDKAFALYKGFDEAKGVEDIQATIDFLRKDPACNGRVGAIGYCLGGKLAYLAATRTSVDAAVGYYGVGIANNLNEAGNIKKPLLLHVAMGDKFVPPPEQEQMHRALDAHSRVSIFDYAGVDHAFARKGGEHYNQAAAEQANSRTLAFLKRHLVAPAAMPEKPPAPPPPRPTASLRAKPSGAPPAPRAPAGAAPAVPKPGAPRPAAPKPATATAPAIAPAPAQPRPAPKPTAPAKPAAKPAARKPAKKAKAKKPAARKAATKPKRKAKKPAKRPARRKAAARKRGRR
jgi:carboxymethylenebutenolidase